MHGFTAGHAGRWEGTWPQKGTTGAYAAAGMQAGGSQGSRVVREELEGHGTQRSLPGAGLLPGAAAALPAGTEAGRRGLARHGDL